MKNFYRFKLLQKAIEIGIPFFARELFMLLRDEFGNSRYHILLCEKNNVKKFLDPNVMSISCFENWESIPSDLQKDLKLCEESYLWWKMQDGFSKGWLLWIGSVNGELVTFSWTRAAHLSDDFFVDLDDRSLLIWETMTRPEFRGKGYFPAIISHICDTSFKQGIDKVYASCRDYNFPSKATLIKIGFSIIGHGVINRKNNKITYKAETDFLYLH